MLVVYQNMNTNEVIVVLPKYEDKIISGRLVSNNENLKSYTWKRTLVDSPCININPTCNILQVDKDID